MLPALLPAPLLVFFAWPPFSGLPLLLLLGLLRLLGLFPLLGTSLLLLLLLGRFPMLSLLLLLRLGGTAPLAPHPLPLPQQQVNVAFTVRPLHLW